MDHVFIAVSLSTYDLPNTEITDIAAVRTSGQVGRLNKNAVKETFTTTVGKDGSPAFHAALRQFKTKIIDKYEESYVVVGYLTDVTRAALRTEYGRANVKEDPFAGHAWVDLAHLAWPMMCNGILPTRTLDAMAEYFKVEVRNESAADTCTTLLGVYNQMMRRYKTALAGEDFIRDVGGDTLENFRRIIGF